jgi:hypothetical protein
MNKQKDVAIRKRELYQLITYNQMRLTSIGLPSKIAEQAEEKSTEQLAVIDQSQALMVMCLN